MMHAGMHKHHMQTAHIFEVAKSRSLLGHAKTSNARQADARQSQLRLEQTLRDTINKRN